jgi:hypothetical protein
VNQLRPEDLTSTTVAGGAVTDGTVTGETVAAPTGTSTP